MRLPFATWVNLRRDVDNEHDYFFAIRVDESAPALSKRDAASAPSLASSASKTQLAASQRKAKSVVMNESLGTPPSSLFVQLLAKHQSALSSFVGSLVPSHADVDDIMQETSLALWKKWGEYDVSRDFFRWACGVAHIQVLRHRRKSATDRLWFSEELIELLSFEMLEQTDLFELRRDALDSCVRKLPTGDRAVIELRYQSGMTVDRVAESLGKTSRTVHRMLSRIRRMLYQCITATLRDVPRSQV